MTVPNSAKCCGTPPACTHDMEEVVFRGFLPRRSITFLDQPPSGSTPPANSPACFGPETVKATELGPAPTSVGGKLSASRSANGKQALLQTAFRFRVSKAQAREQGWVEQHISVTALLWKLTGAPTTKSWETLEYFKVNVSGSTNVRDAHSLPLPVSMFEEGYCAVYVRAWSRITYGVLTIDDEEPYKDWTHPDNYVLKSANYDTGGKRAYGDRVEFAPTSIPGWYEYETFWDWCGRPWSWKEWSRHKSKGPRQRRGAWDPHKRPPEFNPPKPGPLPKSREDADRLFSVGQVPWVPGHDVDGNSLRRGEGPTAGAADGGPKPLPDGSAPIVESPREQGLSQLQD